MVATKVLRVKFRYPKDMPGGDKRNITIKSGYRASGVLRDQHKVVYRNLVKKYAIDGVQNTTRSAMGELNRRYPERYQELRLEFQKSMVDSWRGFGNNVTKREHEVDNDPLVRAVEDLGYCDPLEGPGVQKGFLARLFRRG